MGALRGIVTRLTECRLGLRLLLRSSRVYILVHTNIVIYVVVIVIHIVVVVAAAEL